MSEKSRAMAVNEEVLTSVTSSPAPGLFSTNLLYGLVSFNFILIERWT